jgi:exodeoxyribonuclease-5
MGRDLESFGKPILIVGDPYQLKPVYGDGYYDLSNPDVPLTKIYRQHEGSGILALATAIREGRKISRAELGPDVSIIKKSRLKPKQTLRGLLWPDRIITATNDTRLEINGQILGALGFGPYPAGNQGEKLICLQKLCGCRIVQRNPG